MNQAVKKIVFCCVFIFAVPFSWAAQYPSSSSRFSNSYNQVPQQNNSAQTTTSSYQMMTAQPHIITVVDTQTGTSIVLGGTVVPLREVTLSAQVSGRIEYLAGIEGDWFHAGQVIAAVDDDDLQAKRQQALANINSQMSAVQNAQVQYSREFWSPQSRNIGKMPGMALPSMFDQFFTRPFGSAMGLGNPLLDRQADLYSQNSQLGMARSQHIGAISQLQGIDALLRDTKSIAPFSGVVVKKLVEVGDTVQPGQALFKFADAQYLQIQVEIPSRLMSGIQQDMTVPAVLDVGNTRVMARVSQIYPMADTKRHTVTVKFDIPEGVPGGPGMYAEVMIPDVNAPVNVLPLIPNTAVVWRGSLPAVFVQNAKNESELRLLRLGETVDNMNISVLSGLRSGERIYAQPTPGMASGWKSGVTLNMQEKNQ
ncbi:MAG: efflux RND transporter periplasmic adaptor subunit [Gammaproteobacteria bacterium]|nr:efflux RND transporter periplasmic adaptor subunit [Gammaproteobacteria bacterium]